MLRVYAVHLEPPDVTVRVPGGNALAAIRNAAYFHGPGFAGSSGCSYHASARPGAIWTNYPPLYATREQVPLIAKGELRELQFRNFSYSDYDEDRVVQPAGKLFEIFCGRRRSGVVVQLTAEGKECWHQTGGYSWDTPPEGHSYELLRFDARLDFSVWPAQGDAAQGGGGE